MDVLCIINHYIKIMDVLCIMNHYIKIMDVLCIINHYINRLDWHLRGNAFFGESTFFWCTLPLRLAPSRQNLFWEKYMFFGAHYLLDWHLRGKTFFGKSTFFWCTLPLRLAPSRQFFFWEKYLFLVYTTIILTSLSLSSLLSVLY